MKKLSLEWTQRIVDIASAILLFAGAVSVLVMMLLGTADVVGSAIGFPFPGAFELAEILMVIVVVSALVKVQARNGHIRIELLFERCPAKVQRALTFFSLIAGLLFFSFVSWRTWLAALSSLAVREYGVSLALHVPKYPSKMALAIAFSLLSLQLLLQIWQQVDSSIGERSQHRPP